MSNWKTYQLKDLGIIKTGKTPPSSCKDAFSNYGIPFVTPKDMNGVKTIFKTERYLSKQGLNSVINYLVPKNSIAVSCIGSDMGKAYLLSEDSVTNQQINTLIVNDNHNFEFIYYKLSTIQDYLKSIAGGSATPILNKSHFSDIEIELPDLETQNKFVEKLKYLDQKIQLNTQINQTLEHIAQAIFKNWFVDFAPVRVKADALANGKTQAEAELAAMSVISGKTPEELTALLQTQPEHYAELAEIAAAFPSEMGEIDGVEVPKGWECFSLQDLSSIISKGTTPKKSSMNNADSKVTVPFIKVKDIGESGQILINQLEQIPEKISSTELKRSILHQNDILISIAGTIGRVAIVPNDLENANTNQAVSFIRLHNKDLVGIISTFLKSRKNQEDITSKVIQGVQANISLEVVRNIKVFLPADFNHKAILILNDLLNKQLANQKENLLIEKLRDLSLPNLLNGERYE